jgi:hypothetical protein
VRSQSDDHEAAAPTSGRHDITNYDRSRWSTSSSRHRHLGVAACVMPGATPAPRQRSCTKPSQDRRAPAPGSSRASPAGPLARRLPESGAVPLCSMSMARPCISADLALPHSGDRSRSVMGLAILTPTRPGHGRVPYPAITATRAPDVQTWPERLARNSLANSSAARWSAGRVRWAYTFSVIAPPPAWPRRPAAARRSIPAASIWVAL